MNRLFTALSVIAALAVAAPAMAADQASAPAAPAPAAAAPAAGGAMEGTPAGDMKAKTGKHKKGHKAGAKMDKAPVKGKMKAAAGGKGDDAAMKADGSTK